MRWVRNAAAVVAVVGVVLVGPVPAASAVEATTASRVTIGPDDVPDIERVGGMSLRQKMLTVLGSMLRSDSGVGTSRAHFYSAFNTGFSEAKVRKMMEFSTLNPGGPVPQRVQDYVIQAHEFETPIKTDPKTGVRSFRVTPTTPANLVKGLGGAALTGAMFVPLIGNAGSGALGGWMGMSDMDHEWCVADAQAHEAGYGFSFSVLGLFSGRSCAGFFDFDPQYVINNGLDPIVMGSAGGYSYVGSFQYRDSNGEPYPIISHCYSGAPSWDYASGLYELQHYREWAGEWISVYTDSQGRLARVAAGLTACRDALGVSNVTGYFENHFEANGHIGPELRLVFKPDGAVVEGMTSEASDPERYIDCVVTLDDGSILSSRGATYQESGGQVALPACPSVPDGRYATNVSMTEHGGGGPVTLYEEDTLPEYQQWAENYPECADGACLLDLRIKSGTVLGPSCFDVSDQCVEWWQDPNKASNYQCTYGAHDVSIDECAVYAGIFKPERVAVGAPYSDPMTGEWNGSQSAPRLDGQAMAQGIQNPAAARACNGMNITGFDPVGFVMRPIQCALEWAFVPRPLVVEAELTKGDAAWDGKPPQVIATVVEGFAVMPSASGCSRSVNIFAGEFQTSITPLDACPGSWTEPVAAVSRVVTAAAMVVLVVVVVRRQIAGMVGYGQGQ